MRLSDKTMLITFYSYKGGVGRTMAVANAACQMANKHGKGGDRAGSMRGPGVWIGCRFLFLFLFGGGDGQ